MLGRTEIREKTAEVLENGFGADATVSRSRGKPFEQDQLSAVSVHTTREEGDLVNEAGTPRFRCRLDLVIGFFVDGETESAVDAKLDALVETGLAYLLKSPDWNEIVRMIESMTTELGIDSTGNRVTGEAILTLRCVFQEDWDYEPATDLRQLFAEWDMASPRNDPQQPSGPDGQIDATDTLNINP